MKPPYTTLHDLTVLQKQEATISEVCLQMRTTALENLTKPANDYQLCVTVN